LPDIITCPEPVFYEMSLSKLSNELLLLIADNLQDDCGQVQCADLNSLVQCSRALYSIRNRELWKSVVDSDPIWEEVLTELIHHGGQHESVEIFLKLGANVEIGLTLFQASVYTDTDEVIHENHADQVPRALLVAVHLNDWTLVQMFLKYGAQVVQYCSDDDTKPSYSAIHAARSKAVIFMLLAHGANPNQSDTILDSQSSWRPLRYYIERGNLECMQCVLQSGAILEPIGDHEFPLHAAAAHGISEVKMLINFGANIRATTPTGALALHYAAHAGLLEVVRVLLRLWPESKTVCTNRGYSPLIWFEGGRLFDQLPQARRDAMLVLLK
jgi:hypothetical protein